MRAAVFGGAGKPVTIENVPDPVPGDGQVVVKVEQCGICGTDVHMAEEHEGSAVLSPPAGSSFGHEFCGEVVALGAGVDQFRVGDRISAMPLASCGTCVECAVGHPFRCAQMRPLFGGFGEFALANARYSSRIPASFSSRDGALVEPLAAALRSVRQSGLTPGAKVLVLGAGAMGLGAIFWARRLGAGRMVAAARSRWREPLALEMGASAFVVADDDLAGKVYELLDGPPDIVFEAAGVPGTIAQAINLVRPGGTVLVEGGCMHSDHFVPFIAMWKEVRLQFSCAYTAADFRFTVDTLEGGAREPRSMVTDTLPLDAMPAALESLRGSHHQCKVMVAPWL